MATTLLIKPLGLTAASLGIIQGLAWTILTLLAVLIHFEAWDPEPNILTYGGKLSYTIIYGYVKGSPLHADVFIRPREFCIWAILFMVIAIFWMTLSFYLLIVLVINRKRTLRKVLLAWSIWTVVVCIADLLLVILFAVDYNTLVTAFNSNLETNDVNVLVILSCGIVMALVGRGFILWIANASFAIITLILHKGVNNNFKVLENDSNSIRASRTHGRREQNNDDSRIQSFGTFNGLPRILPVQSANENVKMNKKRLPINLDHHNFSIHESEGNGLGHRQGPPRPLYA